MPGVPTCTKLPELVAFLAGELAPPGADSCFLMAGGVEDSLLNGRTGCTGVLRDPIERGKVWLLDSAVPGGRLLATVNFLPEAETRYHLVKIIDATAKSDDRK